MDDLKPPCRICRSERTSFWRSKGAFYFFRCRVCSSLTVPVSPEQEVPPNLYDDIYGGPGFHVPEVSKIQLARLVSSFEFARQSERLLDVGFGGGGLLEAAAERGWKCFGLEDSEVALARGRARGWNVSSRIDDPVFPAGSFDVVAMIELLEHLSDPRTVLDGAARLLRPGGLLYLTTPNALSLNRWLLGARWTVFGPPGHRTFFSRRGLRLALSPLGFEKVQIHTTGLNPAEFTRHFSKADSETTRYVETGHQLNEIMIASPRRRAIKHVANRTLSLFGIGDTVKASAIRSHVDATVAR